MIRIPEAPVAWVVRRRGRRTLLMVRNLGGGKIGGCLAEAGALLTLGSHLAGLRHGQLSESEGADASRAIADFCQVVRRRGECWRGQSGAVCLAIALKQIERVREVDRISPSQRLGYWGLLLVGAVEKGETANRRP